MLKFEYYTEKYFYEIEKLILKSYEYDFPLWGLSRHEFCKALHPDFKNCHKVWTESMGVYLDGDNVAAAVLSEGCYEGDAFLLFDSRERAGDKVLIERMVKFAVTYLSKVDDNGYTNMLYINVPDWHAELKEVLLELGFEQQDHKEKVNILHFDKKPYNVNLPEDFYFAEDIVESFYLSNVHRSSFNYGLPHAENGSDAFSKMRTMKNYDPKLEVVILDDENRPVGFAVGWMSELMPYAELEPMAVSWWCRRKGLATALIYELSNRIKSKYPHAYGIIGGNQPFYEAIGFKNVAEVPVYVFKKDIYKSWDSRSKDVDYSL